MERKRDEVLALIRSVSAEATEALAAAPRAEPGIHRLRIPTPFAVGRVNCYLIEDDAADAGRHRAELGQGARRARSASSPSSATRSRTSSWSSSPTSTSTTSGSSRSSPRAPAPRSRRSTSSSPSCESFGEDAEADDEFAAALMRRYGIPEDVVIALRSVSRQLPRLGLEARRSPGRSPTASCSSSATASSRSSYRPGHSPSDTVFWDAERADPDRRRPPDRAHLLQPAARAPARRLDRAAAGAGALPRVAAQDPRAAGRDRPLRPRRADHRSRRADRRALRAAPSAAPRSSRT